MSQNTGNSQKLIDLDSSLAKAYFLKSESYCSIEIPSYFDFWKMLNKLDTILSKPTFKDDLIVKSKKEEDLNYKLISNKDWKYARRSLEIINPVLYVWLINEITSSENWLILQDRFKYFERENCVDCKSMPVMSLSRKKDRAEQILTWLSWIEEEVKALEWYNKKLESSTNMEAYALWLSEFQKQARANLGNNVSTSAHLKNLLNILN